MFKEMQDFLRSYSEKVRTAKIEMIALIDPANLELEDFPDYGDYFTLQEFKDNCECGDFIDNDGTNYFCIGQKMSQISSPPSLVLDPRADLHVFDGSIGLISRSKYGSLCIRDGWTSIYNQHNLISTR